MTDCEKLLQYRPVGKRRQEKSLRFNILLIKSDIKSQESNEGHLVICTHANQQIFSKAGMREGLLCTSRTGHKPVKSNQWLPMIQDLSCMYNALCIEYI